MIDIEKVEAALARAATKAVHGTREERSGKFGVSRPMTTPLSEDERQWLRTLVIRALARSHDDTAITALNEILRKISGVDRRILVEKCPPG